MKASATAERQHLSALAVLFLKLGTLAFGGPAAHIAMMRQEVVERRAWLTDAEFLDLLGAANLIPGPSSTELAIHIGYRKGGWLGLLLAGLCFILPAALIVTTIAAAYQRFHALPQVEGVMYGVKPVVVAVVLDALWKLCRASLKTIVSGVVAAAAFVMASLSVYELLILLVCGVAMVLLRVPKRAAALLLTLPSQPLRLAVLASGAVIAVAEPVNLVRLFLAFAKIGAIVFGSGYVLLAFLQADLVDRLHWLTSKQLLDAVAIGQVTPGPVFTTATFIGYLLAGLSGALVATIGIFLPGFILVALSGPLVPRIRRSPIASAFLDGVTAGSIALIAWVLCLLARAAFIDALTIVLALVSAFLLFRYRTNAAWLIIGAGIVGVLSRIRT